MTINKKPSSERSPSDKYLFIDDHDEVTEICRANSRYGISWFLGEEAVELSIQVAHDTKDWLVKPIGALVFVGPAVDYIVGNLEKARDNPLDPHHEGAKAVLDSMMYEDDINSQPSIATVAALPTGRLKRAS